MGRTSFRRSFHNTDNYGKDIHQHKALSGAHNRRLAEYLANIRKGKIYIRTDLMAKNEEWVSPELGDTSLEERTG